MCNYGLLGRDTGTVVKAMVAGMIGPSSNLCFCNPQSRTVECFQAHWELNISHTKILRGRNDFWGVYVKNYGGMNLVMIIMKK